MRQRPLWLAAHGPLGVQIHGGSCIIDIGPCRREEGLGIAVLEPVLVQAVQASTMVTRRQVTTKAMVDNAACAADRFAAQPYLVGDAKCELETRRAALK